MSLIKLQGNASGTGAFTIAAPNGNTDRTLTLPDATGTVQVSGAPISGTTGTFTGLIDISAAGAGQITFPATQNPSSNGNTLDDYEEGTWSPSVGGTATYSSQQGRYTKVGRIVVVEFDMTISSLGTGSNGAIVNLPFTCLGAPGGAGVVGYFQNLTSSVFSLGCRVDGNTTTIVFQPITGATATIGGSAILGNGTRVNGTVVYAAA